MLKITRRKVALILPITFWESRRRDPFFQEYPPARFWPCSDRPSMPPGQMEGERDRWGAVIQPESRGGTMPYGWFVFERGFAGDTIIRRLPLRMDAVSGSVKLHSVADAAPAAAEEGAL